MDKMDIKAIVNDEIKKYINDSLDKEIKKILRSSNSTSRDEVINIIKNAFDSVYKVLWQRKNFWSDAIK